MLYDRGIIKHLNVMYDILQSVNVSIMKVRLSKNGIGVNYPVELILHILGTCDGD